MTTHSLAQIQHLVKTSKEAKSAHLNNALQTTDDTIADHELMLAESLAFVECYAQISLVRYLRMQNAGGNL